MPKNSLEFGSFICDYCLPAVQSILLVIGHKVGATHSYFSSAADVYRFYGLFAVGE